MLSTVRTATRAAPLAQRAFSTTAARSKRKDTLKVRFTPAEEQYPLAEAVRVLRALEIGAPGSVFDIELITKIPKQGHALRGQVALPRDPRKEKSEEVIVVFADPSSQSEAAAKALGVTVGAQELCEPILKGELVPTKVFATPTMMPTVTKHLARFLGPKGLMPTVKRGNVGEGAQLARLISEAGNKIDWHANDLGIIRNTVALMQFSPDAIEDNVRTFVDAVRKTAERDGDGVDITSRKRGRDCECLVWGRGVVWGCLGGAQALSLLEGRGAEGDERYLVVSLLPDSLCSSHGRCGEERYLVVFLLPESLRSLPGRCPRDRVKWYPAAPSAGLAVLSP